MWVNMKPVPIQLDRDDMEAVRKAKGYIDKAYGLLYGVTAGLHGNTKGTVNVPTDGMVYDLKQLSCECDGLIDGKKSITGYEWV